MALNMRTPKLIANFLRDLIKNENLSDLKIIISKNKIENKYYEK